jgi:hypothetical protein
MTTLGAWSVINLAGGGVGWALAENPRARAFHQGNALWNTVNLGLAVGALAGTRMPQPPFSADGLYRRSRNLDRALAVNALLDVGYLAGGLALREVGRARDDARFLGWGDALLVQGGYLLAFDLSFRAAHRPWTAWLRRQAISEAPSRARSLTPEPEEGAGSSTTSAPE